jgi:hypothetical protein
MDTAMSTQVEYLFASAIGAADQAARKQGWQPYGRSGWIKPDGVQVCFICFAEQLAVVPAGTTVHVIGKVTPELRRFKRITLTAIAA